MFNIVKTRSQAPTAPPSAAKKLGIRELIKQKPNPGDYFLGAEISEGGLIPVVIRPKYPIALATAEQNPGGLLALARTAATTARESKQSVIVTQNPQEWWDIEPRSVLLPDQFALVANATKNNDVRPSLIVLDRLQPQWGIRPELILTFAAKPGVSVLITTAPEYAALLAHSIQSALIIVGNIPAHLYPKILCNIPPIPHRLAPDQFAVRNRSRWLIFSTATQL